jgi:hypothetical protein
MNYDFSKFHPLCGNKGLVMCSDGLCIYCTDCGIVANVEAISAKITPADACVVGKNAVRTPQGDQSFNVDKGEVIKK